MVYDKVEIHSNNCSMILQRCYKLEQLEHMRSEIPLAAPWLPILLIMISIRSHVIKRQSQSYKLKKIAKN